MSHSDAILDRLMSLHPKVIDLSLDRMHRLLAALGNPERRIPPVIHVAGTNGKGSTQAIIRAGLQAGGARVHAVADVPVAGADAGDGHPVAEPGVVERPAGNDLGHGGAADVPGADEHHPHPRLTTHG